MTAGRPAVALAGLLLALSAAAPAGAQGFFDKLGKDAGGLFSGGGDKPAEPAAETEKAAAPASATDGVCGGDGQAALASARVEQGLGTIDGPELTAYLDGVLAKLVAASAKPDCKVRVLVTPHDTVQAVAMADGGILVAIGFLKNLKSEDEVAALLGHELAHVLLNHHASDSFVASQDELLKGLDAANTAGSMLAGVVDPGLGGKIDTVGSVGVAVHGVSEGLIAPAWTREQEDSADLLGADLAAAAGYNPRGMSAVLEVIAAHEAANAQVDEERQRLREQKLGATLAETAQSTDTGSTWSLVASAAKLTTAAVGAVAEGQKQHRPASERKQSVDEHVREKHARARRLPFSVEPWEKTLGAGATGAVFEAYGNASEARRIAYTGGDVGQAVALAKAGIAGRFADDAYPRLAFSEVRLKQGKEDAAAKNLELAMQAADAPWQVYRAYADLQLRARDAKAAAATVARADKLYGQPLGLATYAIKVNRAAGDRDAVNRYLDRCADKGTRAHLELCLAEAGIDKDTYRKQRLLRGG